ncbi:HAD family hydrolase [Vibrio alginolyticus]
MVKAVLFDMDGLIFDTESIYKLSWQDAAKKQVLEISDEFYQQFIGVQDPECERMLATHFAEQIDMTRYCSDRDEHFHALREKGIAFKPGFAELFANIKSRGLKTAIVTSSHRPEVEHNFRNSDYLSQFDLVITAEDVDRGKPNPDCYVMAYQALKVNAEDCIVLEDSNNGVKAGLDAGCRVVMVPDLLPPQEQYLERVTVISMLDEAIPLLDYSSDKTKPPL